MANRGGLHTKHRNPKSRKRGLPAMNRSAKQTTKRSVNRGKKRR